MHTLSKKFNFTHLEFEEQEELIKQNWFVNFKTLKEGQHFGELALAEKNKLRAARMMCSKNCSLLVITRE
jgi:hypothetical protein